MAMRTEPLRVQRVPVLRYPVSPEVAALARQIAGDATTVEQKARRIETHLLRNYTYIPLGQNVRQKSTDDFLLRDKRGHCEYFAAGMVVLLTALDVPARVAGGYYGGQFNPLGGYFIVRRDDAHAWAEVWNGTTWLTYDPTPPALRPGGSRANVMRAYLAAFADSVTYFWDRYVLTYGFADQVTLLTDALTRSYEAASSLRAGLVSGVREVLSARYLLALALLVAIGGAAIVIARGRRPVFDLLAAHLKRMDIEVGPAMTIEEALRQLRTQYPEAAEKLEPLIALYEEESFSPRRDRARVAAIRRRLAELRT
jgi:transglutaminase-like putative cysteine protease